MKYIRGQMLRARSDDWAFDVGKKVWLNENDKHKGFTTVPDGQEVVNFEVVVDVDALIRMIGSRARRSKRGVSKLQGGAVEVRAVSRRRTP